MSVVLLDGAVGTSLWEKSENKVPVWRYNLENPQIVSQLHREYLDAGAKIILANTFGANGAAVRKVSDDSVKDIVSEGVRLVKAVTLGTDAKAALAVGPLTELLEPYGELSAGDAAELFSELLTAGMAEHPDMILLQTFMDLEMMKIAANCAMQYDVPVFCSMSFDACGKTMMGNSVEQIVARLLPFGISAIGLNCSLGPQSAMPILREFRQYTDLPLLFKPNAGITTIAEGKVRSGMDVQEFVSQTVPAAEIGATYIGGCCGTNACYIRALHDSLEAGGWL